MHTRDEDGGSVVAVCDSDAAERSCLELLGKIHDSRLHAQIEVVSATAQILQADADRRNRTRRWVPFLSLIQAPTLAEIHNELASESDGAFAQIAQRYADAERQALDTAIMSRVQESVPITMSVLRAMSALGVEPPVIARKLNRIGF